MNDPAPHNTTYPTRPLMHSTALKIVGDDTASQIDAWIAAVAALDACDREDEDSVEACYYAMAYAENEAVFAIRAANGPPERSGEMAAVEYQGNVYLALPDGLHVVADPDFSGKPLFGDHDP